MKNKASVETKQFSASRVEFKDGDGQNPGSMRLYFSAFGNWDDEYPIPDQVVPGAFSKHLPALIKSGFSSWNHNWRDGALPIGTIEDAGEDDYGAWADISFHSTPEAQAVYTVAKERHDRGKDVVGSMSYITHKYQMVDIDDPVLKEKGQTRGRQILEASVKEVGAVIIPANSKAIVTAVKSHSHTPAFDALPTEVKAMFEDVFQDQTLSIWNLMNIFSTAIWKIDDLDEQSERLGIGFDYEGALRAACAEFTERLVQGKVAEDQEEDAGDGDAGMESMSLGKSAHSARDKSGLNDGRGFRNYLVAMNDVVASIADRTQKRAAVLVKQGKVFSAANMTTLLGHADSITKHGKDMQNTAQSIRDLVNMTKQDAETETDKDKKEKMNRMVIEAMGTGLYVDRLLAITTSK